MKSKAVLQLLDRLKLSNTETVYFFAEESKWKGILTSDTKNKLEEIKPTAFFVFNKQTHILFFDLCGAAFNNQLEKEIHKKVWSFDQSPVIFIIKDSDIEIYNAFAYEKKKEKLQKINTKGEDIFKIFSFWNLQSGETWEWLRLNYYKNTIKQKRVSQILFDNIKGVRERLTFDKSNQSLDDTEANTLILRLIFIRYLIDRNVKLPQEYISGLDKNQTRLSFIDLIKKPRKLNKFFYELNIKFNGVLFKDTRFELSKDQAVALSDVFSGELPEEGTLFFGHDFYFEIFDFSIIPVELISGVYEALIDPETRILHSAVYTPSFLVEYMLSETIDKELSISTKTNRVEYKIFDPSVGSGIFLVQAFRRMVEAEVHLKGKVTKVRLREIALNNLFGIDINEEALKVTCFSIYIAMLDYIDPASILISFKFPDLIETNLFAADFFDTNHIFNENIKSEKVDFILGNPPWKSNKGERHIKWLKENNKVTGRYEIAQSFLLRSKDFMSEKTMSALIITSTIFYNIAKKTKIFKSEFLQTFCVDSFFDLSPVRRLVFEEKNSPCAIVFYHLSDGENHLNNIVKHLSVKSNIFIKYFKTLVIEKNDQKRIQQKHFIDNDWMFKVALYGNSLDFALLKKLETYNKKIIDFADGNRFFKGAGIERGSNGDYYPNLEGLPILENSSICQYYTPVDRKSTLKKEDTYLSRGRKQQIFEGSKILFKEQNEEESVPRISYVTETSVFRKGISSLATNKDSDTLKYIYSCLISDLYTYFLFIKSCSWGVSTRPQTRLDEEFLSFPIVDIPKEKKKELITLVDKFLAPFKIHYKQFNLGAPAYDSEILSRINKIIELQYNISGYEKDLIDYVLNVSRYQFQESKQNKIICRTTTDTLENYIEVFLREFPDIYLDENIKIDVYQLKYFVAINFKFQEEKPDRQINFIQDITDESKIFNLLATSLSISTMTNDLFIQKDIKGFEENSFYIIKPNEYKCWHRALAWYDMAEVKEAIENAEIENLKKDKNA